MIIPFTWFLYFYVGFLKIRYDVVLDATDNVATRYLLNDACVLAKKPIFVNNYKPVYWPDIGSKGFKTVMLDDNNLTDESVASMKEILLNPEMAKEIADYNFELGKKIFSYEVLEEKLAKLFTF